jgi:hypothetical protein
MSSLLVYLRILLSRLGQSPENSALIPKQFSGLSTGYDEKGRGIKYDDSTIEKKVGAWVDVLVANFSGPASLLARHPAAWVTPP